MKSNRLIVARLNGIIDFVTVTLTQATGNVDYISLRSNKRSIQTTRARVTCTAHIQTRAHQTEIGGFSVSAALHRCYTRGDDGYIHIWSTHTQGYGNRQASIHAHTAPVQDLCIDESAAVS